MDLDTSNPKGEPPAVWLADGGVTSAAGYRAAAVAAGLKASGGPDLAILVSDHAAAAAGVFTRNRVAAAPVLVDRAVLAGGAGRVRAVVVNAGIANACTGPGGLEDAQAMQRLTAAAIPGNAAPEQVLVLSTGVIGHRLPMDRVAQGIAVAAGALAADGGAAMARAIMTTDTRPKQCALRVRLAGGDVVVGGVAKGSGMIHPDMATMLAVVTTDARLPVADLDATLRTAVAGTFNRITVDGDTSTNDTVLALANGAAGVAVETPADRDAFQGALEAVCLALAHAIVRDGEGATRFVTVHVRGATDDAGAAAVARTIATSPLVKTALAGGDPNWGRILAAAGRAGVPVDPDRMTLSAAAGGGLAASDAGAAPTLAKPAEADAATGSGRPPVVLVRSGVPAGYVEQEAAAVFAAPEITLDLDLGLGGGAATYWTTDLTAAYVAINADYTT